MVIRSRHSNHDEVTKETKTKKKQVHEVKIYCDFYVNDLDHMCMYNGSSTISSRIHALMNKIYCCGLFLIQFFLLQVLPTAR